MKYWENITTADIVMGLGGMQTRTNYWDTNYYICNLGTAGSHYHNRSNHLMVNPFTNQSMPDQWCQGEKPVTVGREVVIVSRALWCDVGNHAFSSLDMDMEEGTRTRKQRDKYDDIQTVTVEYHVCGEHVQKFQSEETQKAIKNGEEKK